MEKVSSYTGAVFDKLDKLKSAARSATVTAYCATKSAVGAVGALVGNPLTKDYEVGRHVASFGPNLAWKIYEGRAKSSGQEASLVVFEKKFLETVDKRDREGVLEMMKKGAVQLTRLRHPRLLLMKHAVEESRDCLAFATEPIFASLSNVLGRHSNMPSPPQPEFANFEMYDVERIYGLYQVVEGLTFLHNDAKILQGNLSPENIVITKNGQWKIGGLFFSSTPTIVEGQSAYSGYEWEPRLYPFQPDLNYAAPEYILSRSCDVSCDMYALGALIHAIYNKGKPPYECDNNMTAFKRNVEQMSKHSAGLGSVPQALQSQVRSLLSMTPSLRPDVHQMSKIPFFENVAALTLQYLDSLMQRDDMAKAQFFKSLYKVMPKLPRRVIMQRILPQLCLQFSNHQLIPFVLPNVLLITEDCTDEEYTSLVLPELKPVFKVQEPVQVTIILLQKLDLLLSKTPKDSIRDDVLPMVFRALEAASIQIQEMVLNIIPKFASMVDYPSMKNAVIPRIKTLCLQTSSLSVRVNSLVCIGKILEHLDKYLVMEDILPFMIQIPSREAPTLMAVLGIFKQTMVHKKLGMDKDYLAMKAIPYLFPLAIEPSLNLSQFAQYMKLLHEMVNRVEVDHKVKLEQLGRMQEHTQSSLKFAQDVQEAKVLDDLVSKIDQAFAEAPIQSTDEPSNKKSSSPAKSNATNNPEFNKLFGLTDESKSASLNGDLLNASEFSTMKPSPSSNQNVSSFSPIPFQSTSSSNSSPSSSTSNLLQSSTSGMGGAATPFSGASRGGTATSTSGMGGTATPFSGVSRGGTALASSSSMPVISGSQTTRGNTLTSKPTNMGSMSNTSNIGPMGMSGSSRMSGMSNVGLLSGTSTGPMSGGYNNMGTMSAGVTSMNTRTSGMSSLNSYTGPTSTGPMSVGYNSTPMPASGNMNSMGGTGNMGFMSGGTSRGGTSMGMMAPMSAGAGSMGMPRPPEQKPIGPSWNPSSALSRTEQTRAANANVLDNLYAPELGHLQNKNKKSLSALQTQQTSTTSNQQMGMMGARPQYGGSAMPSSGAFGMQPQGTMGNMIRPQHDPFQSPPLTGSANDLKDIFG